MTYSYVYGAPSVPAGDETAFTTVYLSSYKHDILPSDTTEGTVTDINQMLKDADQAMEEAYKKLSTLKDDLRAQLDTVEQSLAAVLAYRAAKERKQAPPPPTDSEEKPKRTRAPRGSGDSGVAKVLDIIRHNPQGMLTRQVKERLDAEGVEVKNLGNVLSALKKDNLITQSEKRQPWFPVPHEGDGNQEEPTQ